MTILPYGRQEIDESDIDAVSSVLRGDWLTTGPAVAEFEAAFAKSVGAEFAVSCSSGTAALHLAAKAAGLSEENVALVPSVTFLATANAVRYVNSNVVFADCDPRSGLSTVKEFTQASRHSDKPVRVIFPVHLGGQCVEPETIRVLADSLGATVIEDACHALGTTYGAAETKIGACVHSDMAVFSFHPVKTVCCGEGGMVTTNSKTLAEKLKLFRNHGMVRSPDRFQNDHLAFDENGLVNPWYYEMHEIGWNLRLSDIHAALGRSQLTKLERFVRSRREIVEHYDKAFERLGPHIRPVGRAKNCQASWHLYTLLIDFETLGVSRSTVMRRLLELGIGTQVHYIPVHLQPYYANRHQKNRLPGAENYYERALTVPLFPKMTKTDVRKVVACVERAVANPFDPNIKGKANDD
jgi:UDP-4-amino-4,6-dideoxy-N-acetyl-beta-L-altrosamine transaminase